MKQLQSYYSVVMRADFGIYQMRMLLQVVRRCRQITQHADLSRLAQAYCTDGINLNFAIPVQELIGPRTHNYAGFHRQIERMLTDKQLLCSYYDSTKHIWRATQLFYNVEHDEKAGILRFSVAKWLVDYIVDFRNGGYRAYDFEKAMSLRNPNAARLYLLVASVTKPFTVSPGALREMLGIPDKFRRDYDLDRRVLQPAMAELERRGYNGFTYKFIREFPQKKKSKIIGISFFPVKRENKNISELRREYEKILPDTLTNYLQLSCGFSVHEISAQKLIFADFIKLANWQEVLGDIIDRARRKRKNHGYIIQAMKSELRAHGGS